jgi:hypothetical protein
MGSGFTHKPEVCTPPHAPRVCRPVFGMCYSSTTSLATSDMFVLTGGGRGLCGAAWGVDQQPAAVPGHSEDRHALMFLVCAHSLCNSATDDYMKELKRSPADSTFYAKYQKCTYSESFESTCCAQLAPPW